MCMQICDKGVLQFKLKAPKECLENFRSKGKTPQKKGKVEPFPFQFKMKSELFDYFTWTDGLQCRFAF